MVEKIEVSYERSKTGLEMAEQLQSSSIQKTLFDETSSYFTRIANSYEAAE